MAVLLEELLRRTDVEIAVATASPVPKGVRHHARGADFFVAPCRQNEGVFARARALRHCAELVHVWPRDSECSLIPNSRIPFAEEESCRVA